jgi:hypothetical protein
LRCIDACALDQERVTSHKCLRNQGVQLPAQSLPSLHGKECCIASLLSTLRLSFRNCHRLQSHRVAYLYTMQHPRSCTLTFANLVHRPAWSGSDLSKSTQCHSASVTAELGRGRTRSLRLLRRLQIGRCLCNALCTLSQRLRISLLQGQGRAWNGQFPSRRRCAVAPAVRLGCGFLSIALEECRIDPAMLPCRRSCRRSRVV